MGLQKKPLQNPSQPFMRPVNYLFVVLVLLSAHLSTAWTSGVTSRARSQEALKHQPTLPLALSSSQHNNDSEEPAGVAGLIFARPKSAVGASLRRGQERASRFLRNRKWTIRRHRRRRQEGIIELTQHEEEQAEVIMDVPDWACVDKGERHRLGVMKALLKDDFERIFDSTVTMNGKQVHVVKAFPDVYGDLRLLRYLRKDRVQNPESAAERYRSFLDWRIANDVDMVRLHVEQRPFSPPSQLDVLRDLTPCDFDVQEGGSEDTVAAVLYVGSWDTAAITKLIQRNEISLNCFLLYWTHIFESLNLKLHREMMQRKRMIYIDEIADLKGLSMGHLSPGFIQLVLKPWMKVTQRNYPETTKHIVFLNPPKVISIIWNIVTPMVSPGTVAKVQFKRDYPGSCMDYLREEELNTR